MGNYYMSSAFLIYETRQKYIIFCLFYLFSEAHITVHFVQYSAVYCIWLYIQHTKHYTEQCTVHLSVHTLYCKCIIQCNIEYTNIQFQWTVEREGHKNGAPQFDNNSNLLTCSDFSMLLWY